MDTLKRQRPSDEICQDVRQSLLRFQESLNRRPPMAELKASLIGTALLQDLERPCLSAGNSPRHPELPLQPVGLMGPNDCITPRRRLLQSQHGQPRVQKQAQSPRRDGSASLILPMDKFPYPLQAQMPMTVSRLFEGNTLNCRSFSVCGSPLKGSSRQEWIESAYRRLHKVLKTKTPSKQLAADFEQMAKREDLDDEALLRFVQSQPCYAALAALSISHWANLWMHCLPSHFPALFTHPTRLYQLRIQPSQGDGIEASGDYALFFKEGRLHAVQRKEVEVVSRLRKGGEFEVYATLCIDLDSSSDARGGSLSPNWRADAIIYPPRFALGLSDKRREKLQAILDAPCPQP